MVSKPTSTKRRPGRSAAGFILPEAIFAIAITAVLVLVVAGVAVFSGRSFAALANYVELDDYNRIAIDKLTRDLRQANRVLTASTNSLAIEDADGSVISYTYDSSAHTLVRTHHGIRSVLLQGCDRFAFSLGQRNAVNGTYDIYPAATPATCKVVNVAWSCSRKVLGATENTESVQTARIVIRKQGS